MQLKNILVPVDFSQCSKNALKVAISIARIAKAKIHMVNAVHIHTPQPDLSGGGLIEAILMDYESQVQESFNELESEIIELKEVPHEADRFVSYLVDAIFTETERKNIDLIVMGTRTGHSQLEHLLGTRTTDIIESSEVPVLAIPENFTSFHPVKIGFATDLETIRDLGRLEILNWLREAYRAEVMIFHVTNLPGDLLLKDQKLIETLATKLKSTVRTVQADSVVDGIKEFIASHQLDALALMPRKHNLFERLFKKSVTKNIAIDLTTPLLTFHEA